MYYTNIAQEIFQKEINALIRSKGTIGREMEDAVNLVIEKGGKVIISGIGKSGIVAKKIAATLSSTGTPAIFLHPVEAFHGDIGVLQKGDVGLFISKSGETKEILNLIAYFKRVGLSTIGLGKENTSLSKGCDIFFNGTVAEEACPLNLAPSSSTIIAMAFGDAFAACLMKYRGFNSDDFAKFHPAGSLGKRFFLVKDIMHTENLPLIKSGAAMRKALVELSTKSMGAILIVGDNNILRGIYTDGDLKRTMQIKENFLDDPIDNFMAKNPISIKGDCKVSEALFLMENKKNEISVLPVIDSNNFIAGIIRIHDLIKEGLK